MRWRPAVGRAAERSRGSGAEQSCNGSPPAPAGRPTEDLPRHHGHPVAPLSPRQRDVLQLLARGLTTREIARALGISPGNVENHLRAAMQRLGVHRRVAAIVVGVRRGLLTLDDDDAEPVAGQEGSDDQ